MDRIANWLNRNSLYIALITAWVAMCGSLYFSEVRGYVPCVLCWYQRILMYPLTLVVAIGLLRRDWNLPYYVLPFSLIGLGVSTYHYLLEKTDLFAGSTACRQGVSCTTQWINWFGFVTIPFLAMIAFMMITVFCIAAIYRGELADGEDEPMPWQPVAEIVGVVVIIFLVMGQMAGTPATQASEGFIVETVAESDRISPVEPQDIDPALIAEG
ncbi:MAG: disulfide bond formation protein B, partial [Caldilineaceae bacterium]|nr:disulfide bond formation protein B [Caldilineaceae bacterium]